MVYQISSPYIENSILKEWQMRSTGFDRFVEVKDHDLGCCGDRASEIGAEVGGSRG